MGPHTRALSLSTDGSIAPEAWAAARAGDAAESAPTCAPVRIAAVVPRAGELVKRMARAIADAAVKRASVHVKDFERLGVDAATAHRLFPAALARARAIEPALDGIEQAAA